jgi:hypothetical protein
MPFGARAILMISGKALLGATFFGAAIALPVAILSLPSGLTCCLAFALYPAAGASYAFLDPMPRRGLPTVIVGGATSAIGVLLFQLLFAAVLSPTDPLASFRDGLLAAPPPYQGNVALTIVGLLMGLTIAASSVATMGAAGAAILRAALQRRTAT